MNRKNKANVTRQLKVSGSKYLDVHCLILFIFSVLTYHNKVLGKNSETVISRNIVNE